MVTTSLIPELGLKHHVLDQGGPPIQRHVPTNSRAGHHHFSDQPIQLVRDLVKLSTELGLKTDREDAANQPSEAYPVTHHVRDIDFR